MINKTCSSQYFDRFFAFSFLGCFAMLSSGRSIFHCSSWGQIEELNVLMQLSIGLLFTFRLLSWDWVGMVLWIWIMFSIFYCTAGKLKRSRNLRGAFTFLSWLRWIWSVGCISVAVDLYIVSFDMTDRCCFWKTVLCWFGLLGRLAWELAHMLFQRWVQMGFSSLEVSCGVSELTRLWMLCRVDPRGLVRLSGQE